MLIVSYKTVIRFIKYVPICPWPKAVGLWNIPKNEPTIYVYNHVHSRVEPLFLALAAPANPPIRFFADIKVTRPEIFAETLADVRNSVFSQHLQEKWNRHGLRRKILEKSSHWLTRFLMANFTRYKFIPVFVHPPSSPEEDTRKRRINRQAFETCIRSLEANIPVALAPSGGYTHQATTRTTVPTTLPSLAEALGKRGKTLKIVPSIVKERPPVSYGTYKKYIADRVAPYRFFRLLLDLLKIKRYNPPCLTVQFLPPVTYPHVNSSKEDKVRFVQDLQKVMYDVLNKD